MGPYVTYTKQSAPGGMWNFPPAGEADFVLLSGAVVYLNITASDCQPANPVPSGRVLRTLHHYSKRPYATYLYGEFDKLKWSAYIGMGNETIGTALAGEFPLFCDSLKAERQKHTRQLCKLQRRLHLSNPKIYGVSL